MEGNGTNPAVGKGKAKADEGSQQTEPENGTSSSFTTRLTDSAAHLTRSLLSSRPENDDIARLSSSSSKADAPGGRPLVVGESSSTAAILPDRRAPPAIAARETFRSGQASEEHAAQAEREFSEFLDNTSVFVPSATAPETGWGPARVGGQTGLSLAGLTEGAHSHGLGSDLSVAGQEARDGSEVVAILSAPDPADMDCTEADAPLSEADASALRRALFETGEHGGASFHDWDNALNFIPDFIRPDGASPGPGSGPSNVFKSAESFDVLGVLHGPEAEKLWLDSWRDVLTRYNDEVWGDLGLLVEQAKEEIRLLEQVSADEVPPETKAIQRLQQILGHIRKT